jgi:ribosomal protein S18 acetylase RimI-like enzyme
MVDKSAPMKKIIESTFSTLAEYLEDSETIKLALREEKVVKGCIILSESKWDSDHFGLKIGKQRLLLMDTGVGLGERLDFVRRVEEIATSKHFKLLFFRVPLNDISTIQAIEREGGLFTDNLVTFYWQTSRLVERNRTGRQGLDIDPANNRDEKALQKLCENIFTIDHFHNDPRLSRIDSTRLYSKWISNCLRGLADTVIVARRNRKIVGFITCKVDDNGGYKFGTIDLVGVEKSEWGRHIGTLLVTEALEWFRERTSAVFVGTQGGNNAAVSLYQKCGFRLVSSEATLHLWLKSA